MFAKHILTNKSEQIINSNIDIFKLMSKSSADPLIRQLLCSSRARKLVRLSHLSSFLMCFSSVARARARARADSLLPFTIDLCVV